MLRFLRYILEILAALVGVAIVLGVIFAWKLHEAPVKSDFLTPYVKAALENVLPKSQVQIGATELEWNRKSLLFAVHAENVRILNLAGTEIASVPTAEAHVSLLGILFGQFVPHDLTIDHPEVKLNRDGSGRFTFGSVDVGGNGTSPSTQDIGATIGNAAQKLSRSVFMRRLAITNATVIVHDWGKQKNWAIAVPEISMERNGLGELNGALEGRFKIEITQKDAVAALDAQYTYRPLFRQHDIVANFENVTPSFLANGRPESLGLDKAAIVQLPLSGKVALALNQDLTVTAINAQIRGGEGQLAYADFWDKPVPVKSLDIHAIYNRLERELTVSDTRIDFRGPVLEVQISGVPSAVQGQDLDYLATVRVDNLPMNRFSAVWPKTVLPNPREWLVANLRDGTFARAEVTLNGSLMLDALENFTIAGGSGKVTATNGTVTYVEGMPPVKGVDALATFDLKKMDVRISGGGIGNVRMQPFTLAITGLADVDQYIDIPLQVAGPLPDVLALLDSPPLGYAKRLGISPQDLKGNISGTVTFNFPLLKALKMEDVGIKASANATNLGSAKLIPGVPLDQGNVALTLDTNGFALKGQINLGKAPFQVQWQEYFEAQKGRPLRSVTATGAVREDQWKALGISAFEGTKGPINVSVQMTKPSKDSMTVAGSIDMTPAALTVEMLGWNKAAHIPATAKFTATAAAGAPVQVSDIALRGPGVNVRGNATLTEDMSEVLSLDLEPFIVGRTDAVLHFVQSFGEDGALRFTAKGRALDVGGLRGGNDPKREDPRPKEYHIDVEHLYVGPIGEIVKAHGAAARDKAGWVFIDFSGLAEGDTPIAIKLKPQPDGRRTFAITTPNFGQAMKGLSFTDTIRRGKVNITGASTVENPRVITGKAKIGSFTVEKLPLLALLINATSPFGFANILTDTADFSRFDGDFIWQGDTVTFTRAHASGSAMGINIEGKVDMNSGQANLQGTLVPFSLVNKFINYIPLIGEIITGGQDQGVLAVSYTIDGDIASPRISVNPISLLTPGFIRNLFFGGDIEDEEPEPAPAE